MKLSDKIRENLSNLNRRGRYENTLKAFLSEDEISITLDLDDKRPSEVTYRMDDLISKKGWQNKITVLEHSDSVILINQGKGRYLRLISDVKQPSKGAIPSHKDSQRGAYFAFSKSLPRGCVRVR